MKFLIAPLVCLGLGQVAYATVSGFDISHYQPSVDFAAAYSDGARFVIIKATEGTDYLDPSFSDHYNGATAAGLIRGGYHFAHLDSSSGATQANYFLAHGGGWSGDGITLPGMLDLEGDCVLSASGTVSWIKDFSDTYHSKTGVYPLLYSNPSWWRDCTGDSGSFVNTNPLVLADYASTADVPGGWPFETFWQFNDAYAHGGDSDLFNGDMSGLMRIASG